MDGVELFDVLVKSTGLPEDIISGWLDKKIDVNGYKKDSLSMEQVRELLSEMLLEIIEEN